MQLSALAGSYIDPDCKLLSLEQVIDEHSMLRACTAAQSLLGVRWQLLLHHVSPKPPWRQTAAAALP